MREFVSNCDHVGIYSLTVRPVSQPGRRQCTFMACHKTQYIDSASYSHTLILSYSGEMSIHSEPLSLFHHKLSFSLQSGQIWSHSGSHFFGSHFWLTFSFFNFVFTFCFEMLTTVYRSATFWYSALAFAVVLRFSNRPPIHFTFASMCQPPFPLREGSGYQIG